MLLAGIAKSLVIAVVAIVVFGVAVVFLTRFIALAVHGVGWLLTAPFRMLKRGGIDGRKP